MPATSRCRTCRPAVPLSAVAILLAALGGCTAGGSTPAEKRASIMRTHDETMAMLHRERPETQELVRIAAGHGVFSNIGAKLLFISAGGGYGVVEDHATGRRTFMRMGEAGVGLGLGIKDFRAAFIFHDAETLNRFVTSGWDFGAEADAALKATDRGGAVSAAGSVQRGMSVYQFTETGVALSATVQGTKYWPYHELNAE
ncbi:MAG: hypothetical protein KF817_14680 [Phycisphaeraceae bacterium]|nr:hypothetical protein [Phycisphaeraceae bacterium]